MRVKFGKPSEVTTAHIQHIQCTMSLPTITQTSVGKVHDFYEKLVTHSQDLDTMARQKKINGVRLTLDKLTTICADLI